MPDEQGKTVIAKLHAELGENRIVMLPDGSLVARLAKDAADSPEPFKPAAKDEIVQQLIAGGFRQFKTKTTRHFVFVYNTSEEFAVVTSKVLETMVPGVLQYMAANKLPGREPEVPLVVLMFRTESEFQAFKKMPSGVVAYYTPTSNHVVLYEESPLFKVKPELAIQESLSTIAHEGAHQILHNIGVQQRLSLWPMWLSEGLAEYFAPTSTGKKLSWKGPGQVNDMRMFELENFLKTRDTASDAGQMIEHTVKAARLTSTGYASAWSLTHYLAKQQRVEFHKFVGEVAKLGPLEGGYDVKPPGLIPENQTIFQQHFGNDAAGMEKKLVQHLKKQPYSAPFAEWPHIVVALEHKTRGKTKREANVFLSMSVARKWSQETIEKLPADQRDAVQSAMQEFPNRPAAEAFLRQWLSGR